MPNMILDAMIGEPDGAKKTRRRHLSQIIFLRRRARMCKAHDLFMGVCIKADNAHAACNPARHFVSFFLVTKAASQIHFFPNGFSS